MLQAGKEDLGDHVGVELIAGANASVLVDAASDVLGTPVTVTNLATNEGVGSDGVLGRVRTEDGLCVASTSRGLFVRIAIEADGSAGAAQVVAGDDTNDCQPDAPFGMDGIALDAEGTGYAALVLQNQLVRIDPSDGSFEVLLTAEDGIHDPASLAFGTSVRVFGPRPGQAGVKRGGVRMYGMSNGSAMARPPPFPR